MQTITISFYGGVEITLARSTVADARVRRQLSTALKDDTSREANAWLFYITQLVDNQTKGIKDRKITTFPGDEKTREMFEKWSSTMDEMLLDSIIAGINQLRTMPSDEISEKKVSALSSNGTSEKATVSLSQ